MASLTCSMLPMNARSLTGTGNRTTAAVSMRSDACYSAICSENDYGDRHVPCVLRQTDSASTDDECSSDACSLIAYM